MLTDFSFVFASNPQAHWWCDLLRGNLLLSLVYSNPLLPALGLALAAARLVCALRGDEAPRPPGLAALLAAAVPFFKVFLGAHLLLGLGVAFVLARGVSRAALVVTALPAAVATAALVLGQGAETVDVAFAPLDLVHVTRETLGLEPVAGLRLAAAAALWLVLSLGLRLVGLAEAWRALRGSTLASATAALALSGWPLGLLFRVAAPEVLANQKVVNDAAYLVEQSGAAAVDLRGRGTRPPRAHAPSTGARRGRRPAARDAFDLAVRREESADGSRPPARADGACHGRTRQRLATGRRRAAAAREGATRRPPWCSRAGA